MKVLFLANIPSPYRVDFFNELGKQCELTYYLKRKRQMIENGIHQSIHISIVFF